MGYREALDMVVGRRDVNLALERIFNATLTISGGERSALRGMNVDAVAIANEVGTTPEIVRKWVKRMGELIYGRKAGDSKKRGTGLYVLEAKVGPAWYKQIGPRNTFELTHSEMTAIKKQLMEMQRNPRGTQVTGIRVTQLKRRL